MDRHDAVRRLLPVGKPWITLEDGRVSEASKKSVDELFLSLGGKMFFAHVEPMKGRSKNPRRGLGELVSEVVAFARSANDLATLWQGPAQGCRVKRRWNQIGMHGILTSLPGRCTVPCPAF